MTTRGQDIASVIKRQIEEFGSTVGMTDIGVVTEVGDGIASIHGLGGVQQGPRGGIRLDQLFAHSQASALDGLGEDG